MKEDTVEEEDVESSLTDHEIDVEDIDDDGPLHLTGKSGGAVVHLQRHRHQGSHSTLRSFKEEDDDEEDEVLDKEEMVDEEDVGGPPVGAVKSKKKSGKKSGGKSSGSGSSGSSSSSNPQIKPKCNCEQLQLVDCHLETKELWDKFNELGTEMIITKTGRSVISLRHPSLCKTPRSIPFSRTPKQKNIPHYHKIELVVLPTKTFPPSHPRLHTPSNLPIPSSCAACKASPILLRLMGEMVGEYQIDQNVVRWANQTNRNDIRTYLPPRSPPSAQTTTTNRSG